MSELRRPQAPGGTARAFAPDVREVMERMREPQVRRLPVVENGRLVGVIALADLARLEGPLDPLEVESVVERVSAPAHLLVPA